MQQTEHIGLSLWELSDRIKMEDFNRDHQKLDAALAALSGGGGTFENISGPRKLVDTMYATGGYFWSYDGPARWEEFSGVMVMSQVNGVPAGANAYFEIQDTNRTPLAHFAYPSGGCLCLMAHCKDPTQEATGIFLSNGNVDVFRLDAPYSSLWLWLIGCEKDGKGATASFTNQRVVAIR